MKKVIMLICVLLLGTQTYAASFDCKKANTKIEKMICSDAKLSELDVELAKLYAETRAELKNHSKELKKLIKDQREWLASLKTTKKEFLKNEYNSRIDELRHTLNLARAKVASVTGPSKDAVMKRLAEQLDKLKELARNAEKVEISETLKDKTPVICMNVWKNIQQASVPEPSVYANTVQQKQDMYGQLRQMALHNKKLFFDMGNIAKEPENYTSRFDDPWKKYNRDFSEYDNTRRDSANLLFIQPDIKSGFKQPIFVTILLDLDENDLSLDRKNIGLDGMLHDDLAGHSNTAYSREYFNDNFLDDPQHYMFPPEYSGLLTLGNEVMFWKMDKNPVTYEKIWSLNIQPVRNTSNGRETSCSFDFNSDIKE